MRLLLLSIVSFSVMSLSAQSKINLLGNAELREINSAMSVKGTNTSGVIIEAIVTMNDGWSYDVFDKYGVEDVTEITENVVVASIPSDQMEAFANDDNVFYVEFGREYKVMMDFARPSGNVTEVQNGFDLNGSTVSFTGKGVVTGLMDTGIDPNHINFTDESGACRVKQAFDFTKNISALTPTAMRRFTTDNSEQTHGTHVAGIMAGSYNGEGDYTYMDSPTSRFPQQTEGNIPYYGVATGSDIVMCGGTLTNANIIKGIKAIVDYAKSVNQPAVINLSLGSNDGAHDGSGSLERSISSYANDAVICISAGNEGDYNMFVGKKFTEGDTELKTIVVDGKSSGIDIWTNSAEPVTVSIGLYTSSNRFTPFGTVSEAGEFVQANSSFTTSMTGSCNLSSDVDRQNNRYHVAITGTFSPSNSRNSVALQIEGKAGQEVYVYGYGDYNTSFTSKNLSGFTNGTNDGTINDMACADGVIAVGSYNSRTSWPTYAGGYSFQSQFRLDEISPFSSYGTSFQGVSLPQVCAPGAAIVSSLNRYYTNSLSSSSLNSETSAKVVPASGLTNYWGEMQGTSMSCPFVAGTVALWLEADPTLTASRIIEVMKATSEDMSGGNEALAKRWGAGKIDALAGIKKVLDEKASVGGIFADDARNFIVTPIDGGYNVYVGGEREVAVTVYDMSGRAVAQAAADENTVDVATGHLAKGVYLLTAQGNTQRHSTKIVVK